METTQLTKVWDIDRTHSEVHFKVKHMMVSAVTGSFDEFEGGIESESDDFENAAIHFTARVNSVNTGNRDRDNDLKSDTFFNSKDFPDLKFVSTSFRKIADGEYKLIGNLTIRDHTKSIDLSVQFNGLAKDHYGNMKAGFEITGEINRKEFGLKYGALTEAGSLVVSELVKLAINIQLTLRQANENGHTAI